MLRNVFLKTLRDNRLGIIGWGLGLGLLLLVGASQYAQLLGPPGAARDAQAAEMAQLLQSFSLLIGEIVPVTTLGGFVTVRVMGFVPVMLSLWTIVVGVSLIRGEEERGALDVLLTTPHSRLAVFGQKAAALGVGLLVVAVLQALGLALGAAAANEPLPGDGLVLAMVNVGTIAAFWGAVGFLVGQLVGMGRTAMTAVGGIMAASYLLDNVLTNLPDVKALTWLLPFHYYSVSKPLVPGRTLDVGPWLVLVVVTGVVLALAAALFLRRDLGGVFPLLPARRAAIGSRGSAVLLTSVWGKALRDVIGPTVGWGVSLALYAALIVGTTNQALTPLRQALGNLPWLTKYLGAMTTNESYLGAVMFSYLPVLLAVFALTQIAAWTGDEEAGRMELLVAEPVPRPRLLLARYGAGVVSLVGILALTGLGILLTSALTDTPLDAVRVTGALGAAGLVGLVVLAGGLALATWLPQPGGAVTITAVIVVVMFFLDAFTQILNWPAVIANLSIFHLYGQPLIVGLAWGGLTALAVLVAVLAPASVVGFTRRDIAK